MYFSFFENGLSCVFCAGAVVRNFCVHEPNIKQVSKTANMSYSDVIRRIKSRETSQSIQSQDCHYSQKNRRQENTII